MNVTSDYIDIFNSIPITIPEKINIGENVYTVFIGKNGIGKSTLLAEMVSNATMLKSKIIKKSLDFPDAGPPTVIAVSTSPFDKFKLPIKTPKKIEDKYHYIGMRNSQGSSAIALISSATIGLIERIIKQERSLQLIEMFKILGFGSDIELIFKQSTKGQKLFDIQFYKILDARINFDDDWLEQVAHTLDGETYEFIANMGESDQSKLKQAIYNFRKMFIEKQSVRVKIDFSYYQDIDNYSYLNTLYLLYKSGLLKLIDLRLNKHDFGRMSVRRASSGEQCMLVMMLGIAGYIEDNALIFIDEPEISLHPLWQEKFISTLIKVFSNFNYCQFFIATHSPQVISRLSNENCFITSLTKKEVFEAKSFNNRSSDYQLAELFEAPGAMNEYINRLAFSLLSSIKVQKSVSTENKNLLNKLLKFSDCLEVNDPTTELISSIKQVANYYAFD